MTSGMGVGAATGGEGGDTGMGATGAEAAGCWVVELSGETSGAGTKVATGVATDSILNSGVVVGEIISPLPSSPLEGED